jgi:hypothetical protein
MFRGMMPRKVLWFLIILLLTGPCRAAPDPSDLPLMAKPRPIALSLSLSKGTERDFFVSWISSPPAPISSSVVTPTFPEFTFLPTFKVGTERTVWMHATFHIPSVSANQETDIQVATSPVVEFKLLSRQNRTKQATIDYDPYSAPMERYDADNISFPTFRSTTIFSVVTRAHCQRRIRHE